MAKSLVKQLQARGFEVCSTRANCVLVTISPSRFRQAVRESDTVVSVIGGQQPSPNVLVEMGMALAQGKRVLPIVIDAATDISTLADFARLHSIRTNDAAQAAEAIATLAPKSLATPV